MAGNGGEAGKIGDIKVISRLSHDDLYVPSKRGKTGENRGDRPR